MRIEHWDETIDGRLTEDAMRRKLERRGYRATRFVYPPGTVFPPHSHRVDKIDAVLAGRFRLSTTDAGVILEAGDAVAVPRGLRHSAEVLGSESVVSLDATAPMAGQPSTGARGR